MIFISLSGLFIFFEQPSYAVTASKDKLSQEEKIERAYEFREGTGFLEEDKQASDNKAETFQPDDKAKEKSVKTSKEASSEPGLVEKAQELIEKVTGQ
jgi:exosome complex RNA-binding protein Csl4